MVTDNQADYLKVIYSENLKQNKITNKFIAEELKISAPSVSAMIKKMKEDNLIVESLSLGIELTKKGVKEIKLLLSKHRLWELFLIEKLNYTWDLVHSDADLLEHVTSPLLLDKLNAYLNYPKTCPHGKPIYINYDENSYENTIKLNNVDVSFEGVIKIIEDDENLLKYLSKKGIDLNTKFKVISIDSFDKTMTIKFTNNKTTSLSVRATEKIFVEKNKMA